MNKLLLGTIGILAVGLAASASAADLPARTYSKAPMMAPSPIVDWSGFYIGAEGGGAFGSDNLFFPGSAFPINRPLRYFRRHRWRRRRL